MYEAHMEEPTKDKEPSLEDYPVLKEYEDVFGVLPGLPPKRDIDLMPGATPVSKTPYRMITMKLKELYMQLEELLKKGYIRPKCLTLGFPSALHEEKIRKPEVVY
jgi:hypothetical protein